jgi:hypothetical protein
MRGLVVAGPADAASLAAALVAWIFETAGLEPGFDLERTPIGFGVTARVRPLPTKRKILAGSAPPPPFVVDRPDRLPPAATTGLLVLAGAEVADTEVALALAEDALVACDVGVADRIARTRARTTLFGLDGDASEVPPAWLGAAAPRDPASGALPFDLFAGGSSCGRFALPDVAGSGTELLRSAVGAIAITAEGFGVDIELARRAVASFGGVVSGLGPT